MSLVVDRITVEGFGSYMDAQVLTLGAAGVTAITGPNGAGKSTIVSKALTWCLYGKTAPERMGRSTSALKGKHVINEEAAACTVTVQLTQGADTYTIKRERKKATRGTIEVTHNRLSLPGEQSTIDGIIGASYDIFVRTIVRGQGDPWNFAEATDGRKREILDVVSGAAALIGPYERAKQLGHAHKAEAEQCDRRAQDAQRRLAGEDTALLERQTREWDADKARRLEAAQQEVAVLAGAVEEAEAHDLAAQQGAAQREAVQANWPTLDIHPYDSAVNSAQGAVHRARAALTAALKAADDAKRLMSQGSCPTCQQALSGAHSVIEAAAADTAPLVAAVEQAEAAAQSAHDTREAARQWLADAVSAAQTQLAGIPAHGAPRLPQARAAHEAAVARMAHLHAAENPFGPVLVQARERRYALERDLAVLTEAAATAHTQRQLAEEWTAVLHPKGVRASMADAALLAIENEANRWLSALSRGKMSIAFPSGSRIDTVVKMGATERPLLAFSGGEKRRINMAVDLAVAATFAQGSSLALSLLVLDEENLSGLDEDGKAAVTSALNAAGVADVVVIDHDPRLSGAFSRTVTVERGPDGHSVIT